MRYVKAVRVMALFRIWPQVRTGYWCVTWIFAVYVGLTPTGLSVFAEPIKTQEAEAISSAQATISASNAEPSQAQQQGISQQRTKVPLDENKLWLPLKYQKHHLPLLRAATVALAQPRCYEVKRGSLDLRQSEPKHAIYRFLCKQASGKTYTEVIDGVTFESLVPRPSSEIACYELLMAQVKMMKQLHWLNDTALTAADGEPERYEWHFDSVSVEGQPLKYTALCQLNNEAIAELKIMPRRE